MNNKVLTLLLIILIQFSLSNSQVFQNSVTRPDGCSQIFHIGSRTQDLSVEFEAYINNQSVNMPTTQGIHILVVSSGTNQIVDQGNWDVNTDEDSEMIDFINTIEDNEIVVVGVNTNADGITAEGYQALESVGFTAGKTLVANEVFTLIGMKNSADFTPVIDFQTSGDSVISMCIEKCSNLCKKCQENNPEQCTECKNAGGRNPTAPDCPTSSPTTTYNNSNQNHNKILPKSRFCTNYLTVSSLNYLNGHTVRMVLVDTNLVLPTEPATKTHGLGRERQRGIYLAVIDEATKTVNEITRYDTGYVQADVQKLINYIGNIQDGKYVMLGTAGKVHTYLNQQAFDAIKTLGADQDFKITQQEDVYSLVGVKGYKTGMADNFLNIGSYEGQTQAVGCIGCEDASRQGIRCDCQPGYVNYKQELECRVKPDDNCSLWLSAESRSIGWTDNNFHAQLNVKNTAVEFKPWETFYGKTQGACILVTNDQGEQLKRECYNTRTTDKRPGDTFTDGWNLAWYLIDDAPVGSIVMLTLVEGGGAWLPNVVRTQLNRYYGFPYYETAFLDTSLVGIGRRGMQPGEALFQSSREVNNVPVNVYVEGCFARCDQNCESCGDGNAENCDSCDSSDSNREQIQDSCPCKTNYFEDFSTGQCEIDSEVCFAKANVISAGSCDGSNAYFYLNGVKIDLPYKNETLMGRQGIYIVVLNQGFQIEEIQQFDVYGGQNQDFIDYVSNIENDLYVLISIASFAYTSLEADTLAAFESLGMDSTTTFEQGMSFAFIGKKGSAPGTAQQVKTDCYAGKAVLNYCFTKCHPNCLTCDTDPNVCTGCDTTILSREDSGQCECKTGYYEQGLKECGQCDFRCLECDTAGSCTVCKEGRDINNDCQCNSGGLVEDLVTGTCGCAEGYYFDETNQQCQACSFRCKSCVGSADNCETCHMKSIGRKQETPCLCQDGYYEESGSVNCKACFSKCATCDSKNTCTSCINPFFKPPFCSFSFRLPYFEMQQEQNDEVSLMVCNYKCLTCIDSADKCQTCANDRNNDPPFCTCKQGYHDENNTSNECIKCMDYCLQCDNSKICQQCDHNLNREENYLTNKCECKIGYKENSENICEKCYNYGSECLLQCPENTVTDQQNKLCLDIQSEAQNSVVVILLCGFFLLTTMILSILLFRSLVPKIVDNFSSRIQKEKQVEFV